MAVVVLLGLVITVWMVSYAIHFECRYRVATGQAVSTTHTIEWVDGVIYLTKTTFYFPSVRRVDLVSFGRNINSPEERLGVPKKRIVPVRVISGTYGRGAASAARIEAVAFQLWTAFIPLTVALVCLRPRRSPGRGFPVEAVEEIS